MFALKLLHYINPLAVVVLILWR